MANLELNVIIQSKYEKEERTWILSSRKGKLKLSNMRKTRKINTAIRSQRLRMNLKRKQGWIYVLLGYEKNHQWSISNVRDTDLQNTVKQ